MHGGGGNNHRPFSRHVILKIDFSSLFLSTQLRVINDPGIASSVDVSNTLIKEFATELRVESIGGGSEHRGFSFHKKKIIDFRIRKKVSYQYKSLSDENLHFHKLIEMVHWHYYHL